MWNTLNPKIIQPSSSPTNGVCDQTALSNCMSKCSSGCVCSIDSFFGTSSIVCGTSNVNCRGTKPTCSGGTLACDTRNNNWECKSLGYNPGCDIFTKPKNCTSIGKDNSYWECTTTQTSTPTVTTKSTSTLSGSSGGPGLPDVPVSPNGPPIK